MRLLDHFIIFVWVVAIGCTVEYYGKKILRQLDFIEAKLTPAEHYLK